MDDLQKRYAEWKAKVSNPEYKGRKKTIDQHQADNVVLRGEDWHNSPGQKSSLLTRKKLYETEEYKA